MSDRHYLNILYKASFGRGINFNNPTTYNEKLQWLKINDRKQIYTLLADKYAVKKFVSETIGDEHIIPTIGVWNNYEDIDFDSLPKQFVLKCTHDSGGLIIVHDKEKIDYRAVKVKLKKCLRKNYYWSSREWPYKNIKPRIIAEPLIVDNAMPNSSLRDYKFFCFNGKVKYLFVASDRNMVNTDVKFDYFDSEFNKLELRQSVHQNSNYKIEKPKYFDKMIEIAEKLSKDIPQVRIDLYYVNDTILFGEYTFFHHGGFVEFIPNKYDKIFGDEIDLGKVSR